MSHNHAIKAMMRNPKAMMDFQLTGRLPRTKDAPTTPLREAIEKIPPRLRTQFVGIKLNPSLGFHSGAQFNDLSQLYTWLGGGKTLAGSQTMPYMGWVNRGFNKKITITDIVSNCSKAPSMEMIKRYIPNAE